MKARLSILVAVVVGASCASVACTSMAWAEDEAAPSYSMADVTACSADAMRLCRHNMPSIKAIETCMRANYENLRPKCKARFKDR